MRTKQNSKKLIYLLLTLFLLVLTIISGWDFSPAFAATSTYSDVLDDLRKDSSFNLYDYADRLQDFENKSDYYKIEVIQIAESTDGELFVYTYQPCQKATKLTATDINMSLSESVDGTQPYPLVFLNSRDVFVKYKLDGFKVKTDKERFYNISSISRDWIKDVDGTVSGANTTNKKAFAVGQYWKAKTQDETVRYQLLKVDVVEIINPFTGYIRRNKNSSVNSSFQDNYFVAFSSDRNIEKLLSASVSYRIQDYFYKANNVLGFGSSTFNDKATFSNERRINKDVYCDEVIDLQQQGYKLFGIFDLNKSFSWQRIQSSADFVNNAGASSSDKDAVMALQWVLMFDEVSVYRYQSDGFLERVEESGQIIDEVTVLRLEFVEDGVTYNLGAVSNTVSKNFEFGGSSDSSDNSEEGFNLFKYIWNCFVNLFSGKASGLEKFVVALVIIVVVVIIVVAVKFGKWVYRGLFK